MSTAARSTIVVHGHLAMRERRLEAARSRRHGLQVMSFEQAAVRIAGGFVKPIDDTSLRRAIQLVLPITPMGELESIKLLPGMIDAVSDTLHKAWRAGISLSNLADKHPRLEAIARIESAVLSHLPAGMLRPVDIVTAAFERIVHAPTLLGSMEIVGITELSPCWRPLLKALAAKIPVQWNAGPRTAPQWLEGSGVNVLHMPKTEPKTALVSAASPYHEAIETMRWLRALLASGIAPSDIAIATASPADYDDHFLALRSDANIPFHFVHGVRAISTREGQAAAALADIVVRGLSQTRLRRLVTLSKESGPFKGLPEGWLRILPSDAPLTTPGAWSRFLAKLKAEAWPDGKDHTPALRDAVTLLQKGPGAAIGIGEAFLKERSLAIWRKARDAGPDASIDATIGTLKQDDGLEGCVSVVWMPASALAASPRRFVRLLGLNSSRWPRGLTEDRLIPDHIIPTEVLDPLPVSLADRRDFETILATTTDEVILSLARRDVSGRLLGRSPLLTGRGEGTYLRRNSPPVHAFSETDRLMSRPAEFSAEAQAISAAACWRDWRRSEVTAHDGLIRADHPLILAILRRTQSASSLRRLLRNPLSFVWVYGFGWREPQSSSEPLVLDALSMGDLVHLVLDRALQDLEAGEGLALANEEAIATAVGRAVDAVALDWEGERPIPPGIIWDRTRADARQMAERALSTRDEIFAGSRSFGEVPFGGSKPKSTGALPWDPTQLVTITDTGFNIAGYIDRLDIAGDRKSAVVRDYKTGRPPKDDIRLKGGGELQRCLYAFAVKALLGEDISISASLFYPREGLELKLENPEAALVDISRYLRAARLSLASGAALPGPDTGSNYDDLALALPANASAIYCKRKSAAAADRLGEVAQVWEAQ